MRCFPFFHKWPQLPEIKVLDVSPGIARMFGNVIVSYRCERCGKVKNIAKFRP